jgi:hypothetical protein
VIIKGRDSKSTEDAEYKRVGKKSNHCRNEDGLEGAERENTPCII